MPRIAKADLNAALQLAAKNIVEAGGADGRTSRAELKAKLAELPKAQRGLTDIFFKFVDNRDFRAGAQVTAKDVSKAVEYAKAHLVAKYDLNNNGLSRSEISAMSLTGKRAVELAKALKAAAGGGGGDWTQVSADLTAAAKDVYYLSETDSSPEPLIGKPATTAGVTEQNLRAAFGAKLAEVFAGDDDVTGPSTMGFDIKSAAESKAFLKDLETPTDPTDDSSKKNAAGFAKVDALLRDNLTDVRVVKVGAKDGHGGLKEDVGLYAYLVVGKTKDGQLAGVVFNSVET